jgi:branched-chain amino acid aminotransferase
MIATEKFLGVRPSQHVTFMVIASPAGAYFKGGVKPVTLWLTEEYTRAGRGGMGAAKTGGNYASSLIAQQEAYGHGCDQVVFLDAQESKYVEELGGMNLYFVFDDGTIVTPESATILEGITRASIMELAGKMGYHVTERKFGIDEWRDGVAGGRITEIFACGTAAVVTPVGALKTKDGDVPAPASTDLTMRIREALVDVQFGRAEDTFGWMHRVGPTPPA